ncbi:hypothetical protein [Micromonospora sp. NPDC047134]|uniref:hypothetical protein n=1 Tax=Micromonospora sp. NPDC047134 TaxID=3154340 RepID=UPI0033D70A97
MILQRVVAVVLLFYCFVGMVLSRVYPFMDDWPELAETAIAISSAVAGVLGVVLWLRKSPEQASPEQAGDGERP